MNMQLAPQGLLDQVAGDFNPTRSPHAVTSAFRLEATECRPLSSGSEPLKTDTCGYWHAATEKLAEAGRLLGGWLRQQRPPSPRHPQNPPEFPLEGAEP